MGKLLCNRITKIMDVSMSEIIRETRNAINSRLDMLDVLVSSSRSYSVPMSNSSNPCDNHRIDVVNKRITSMETILEHFTDKYNMLESTMYKFNDLLTNIQKKIESMEKQGVPIVKVMNDTPKCKDCKEASYDCYCDMPPLISTSEMIPEIVIEDDAISQIKKDMNESEEYCDECDSTPCDGAHGSSGDKAIADMKSRGLEVVDNTIVPIQEEEVAEEEQQQEEVAEEEQEEVAEEEVAEEEVAEQEEALELEEFEYKGMTLYRDSENKVYRMNEENEISEPLGVWDEKSKKIKKIYN